MKPTPRGHTAENRAEEQDHVICVFPVLKGILGAVRSLDTAGRIRSESLARNETKSADESMRTERTPK